MEGKDLEFAVNGERFKVNSVDPSTTLLDFLRLHTPFKSVKLGCGEGKLFFSYFLLYSLSNSSAGGLTVSEAEKSIAGNLCRCTGYRPIVDACKSFAADVDIEDLGLNSFWKKGDSKEAMLKSLPPYNPKDHLVTTFPEFLKKNVHNGLGYRWTTPFSLTELHNILESANAGGSLKLVVGNTGTGYYKDDEGRVDRYVDISRVPEITMIKRDENGIEIGAAVTISNVIDALKEEGKSFAIFKKMAAHMEKIGNRSIRNSGSIGGNLVMAQSRKFPSDIATLLLAADASVYVFNGGIIKKVKLHEFLDSTRVLDTKQVLLKVEIPAWTDDAGLLFETYRAAPRSIGNALPYVNAAFFARVSRQMVDECLLAFGSYGGDHSIRATEVERFLTGKLLSHSVLYEAMCLLRGVIVPGKGTSYPEYRKALAVGFLFEFFSPLIDDNNGHSNGRVDPTESLLPFLSSSQQVVESDEFQPVGEAVIKAGAAIQASGEAVFVDDIPTLPDCLHGAFIYSTEPLAKIKSISFSENVTPAGVFAVLTFKDIPIQGQNIGSKTVFGPGPLFAEELTRCAGQRIALVVADTQKHADRAAKLAVAEYDVNNLEEPILTVEDAVKRSSFFDVHPMFYPEPVGDVLEGMKEADRKILVAEFRLGSQYFFYMEPQTALALPDEDNCVKVFSSSQAPEYVHSVIATCLGIPEHNVRVITRRVGGGFGGKAIKSMPAYAQSVNLSASALYTPEFSSMEYLNYGVGVEVDVLTGKTEILRSDIIYDCGKSLNPAVDLGQVEGAFVQGIGFFMMEEYTTDEKGLVVQQGTWDYKIPTVDTIPKQFNVEILNTGHHKNRVLSSKASGEPPLLLAASVHCATRSAIREARKQSLSWNCNDGNRDVSGVDFELPVPATMPVVKGLCGLYSVEKYLEGKICGK
uniref:indole-3-acetaldehyde oxidase n=1 Tax=Brassica campestris TaxID=3711 RepID=M4EZT2_BRACM